MAASMVLVAHIFNKYVWSVYVFPLTKSFPSPPHVCLANGKEFRLLEHWGWDSHNEL